MPTYNYRYVITNLYQSGSSANPVIAELPFTGVNFTQQLNSNGTFQGHLLLSGLNTSQMNVFNGTQPGKVIIWVLLNSNPIWSGVIWHREFDSETQTISVTAQEMMSLYQRRRIASTKTYTSADPCNIVRDLVQYTEARSHGKTGMTYDSTTSSYSTSKTYNAYEYKSVYQAVKDLAQNYLDFRVYPTVVAGDLINELLLGVPLGVPYVSTSRTAKVFQMPGNIVKYTFPEEGFTAANTLYGLGYGANNTKLTATAVDGSKVVPKTITNVSGNGTLVTYTVSGTNYFSAGQIIQVTGVTPSQYNLTGKVVSSTSSQFTISSTATGTYSSGGTADPDWPLLEDSANYIDIGDINLLKDVTLGQLNAISYPPTTIQIVLPSYVDPSLGTYNVGDEARVNITDDFFPAGLDLVMRIVGIDVSPGENGPDRVTVTLTRQLAAGSVS